MSYAAPSRLKAPSSNAAQAPSNRPAGAPRSKIERYRPGVAPSFGELGAKPALEDEDADEEFVFLRPGALSAAVRHAVQADKPSSAKAIEQAPDKEAIVEFATTLPPATAPIDPRLARLGSLEHRASRHRSAEAAVLPAQGPDVSAAERRKQIKEAALQKQHEQLLSVKRHAISCETVETEPDEGACPFRSECDDEPEEELAPAQPLLKPVFVAKQSRVSLSMEEREEQERQNEAHRLVEIEKRKLESKGLLVQAIQRELLEETELSMMRASLDTSVDDTDHPEDKEADYEAWTLRELLRLKRDLDEAERTSKEREQIENIRIMSEEQRNAYIASLASQTEEGKQRAEYRFLQKYYHKGAFYLDSEDAILQRDYNEPTPEDRVDKSALPQVLQVKNFGKMSRSKWTHLTAEDTTAFDSAWAQDSDVNRATLSKMGGFDRPGSLAKKRKL